MTWLRMLLFPSLRLAIKKAYKLIKISYKQLTLRMFLSDIWSVLSSVGFVAIPAAIVGLLFLWVGQGKDTLLLVIEKMINGDWRPLFFLVFSLTMWSIFSELSVRYAIAVSDNSGVHLSTARVHWRTTVQKLIAALFLLWPGAIILISLIWTVATGEYFEYPQRWIFGGVAALHVLFVQAIVCELYFHKFGKGVASRPKKTIFGQRSLPPKEQVWLAKLYGIYNDYVFTLPKPTNFKAPYNHALQNFTSLYLQNGRANDHFPQDEAAIAASRLVPENFILLNKDSIISRSPLYKWVYCIPPSFYAKFHRQVRIMAITSVLILVTIAVIPSDIPFYSVVGAPALVCLAFSCYTGIYSGLLYVDRAILPRFPLSIRLVLLLWIIAVSYFNNDHKVQLNDRKEERSDIQSHFNLWFKSYKERFDRLSSTKPKRYPVIFICAEGGAFRTGAYTAMLLTQIEAYLAQNKQQDFRRSVFAMSGVSGGSVGLGFYNAVAFRSRNPIIRDKLVDKTKEFFMHDSLSPIIGRMFYGEFLNLFYWENLPLFDRSVVLERAWENAYGEFSKDSINNTYKNLFLLKDTGAVKPVLIINTMEVESGLQCLLTTAKPEGMLFQEKRDLLGSKIKNLRYSTAINFSSRFPFFSPGAMVPVNLKERLHYVDGGYVENTGAASMLEMINLIKTQPAYRQITPVVISLRFGNDTTKIDEVRSFNEFREIISGIINTRSGRSNSAIAQLKNEIECANGIWIDAPLTAKDKDVPMNWVLSSQSMSRIEVDIKAKLAENGPLMRNFFRNDLHYMPLKKN